MSASRARGARSGTPSRGAQAPGQGPGPGARRALSLSVATLWLSALLGAAGCTKTSPLLQLPNQRPTIEVTQAPIAADQPFFYGYELRWAGYDADGFVEGFRYAVDPPTGVDAETTWIKTQDNRRSFLFPASEVESGSDRTAQGYHTIVIQAVDDRGGVSAPVSRSLTAFTIAPTVQITQPVPNHLWVPRFGPSFRLAWAGTDPDGRGTNKPVKYKFRLFWDGDPDFEFTRILTDPDSVRRRYAPHFADWDSVGGDTTARDFRDLIPKRRYIVVVVAIDEVGAFSPVMNFDVNMLYFTVDYAGLLGPAFTVYNESFFFQYTSGGFSLDPASFLRTEAAAGRQVRFNWYATTSPGSYVAGYRWMLDGNVTDERRRDDEARDMDRWSRWSPLTLGVDLPAFNPSGPSETHTLYVEAQDNIGLISLVVIEFIVVRPVFDKELLIVDDTRLLTDRPVVGGCMDRPKGVWPTAAELDTFFFARGGKPWRCYPPGTLSPVGIFQGYSYDTLGTRFLPRGTLTLSQLARYRHVIWYTDAKGARNGNEPTLTLDPMSQLRWLTLPGRVNPLGTWVSQGGKLWMFGGGTAIGTQINWEKLGTPADVFSNADGELVGGRFMYDVFGLRSEITARSVVQATKPPHPIGRGSRGIDYSALPEYLYEKRPETDAMEQFAPNRLSTSDFYQTAHPAEGVTKANDVIEDVDPDPDNIRRESVVDTVYESVGGQLGSARPIMTVYNGGRNRDIQVFSGFQLWYWQRDQQIAIVDWVLQKAWGIPRQPIPR